MANGISSAKMVIALGREGYMCSYGAGAVPLHEVEQAIRQIKQELPQGPYMINILHSQNDPAHEEALVDLLLEQSVKAVEVSAFIEISPAIIRYRLAGIKKSEDLGVYSENKIIAKISREEVAKKFMSPPDPQIVEALLAKNQITSEQAQWAKEIPVADDITAEADSGGHTDGQPFISLLPLMISCRDEIMQQFGYRQKIRVGAAGGISTAVAAAGAFTMGADYIVTGSVNQGCAEAGTSDYVKEMLASVTMADVVMAPSADMFEMGAKVQVIKKGTMFPMNAQKLYDLYTRHGSIDELSEKDKKAVEMRMLRHDIAAVWGFVEEYFAKADPKQLERAAVNPKLKMALIFRWYLGNSSRWAIFGDDARKMDMQIWCGKSMGAFNRWVSKTDLEHWKDRTVVKVADKIMSGAADVIAEGYREFAQITSEKKEKTI
jgi:PfaD family protein